MSLTNKSEEINSEEIKSEKVEDKSSTPEPMDDETDALYNEVCTNTVGVTKKDIKKDTATEEPRHFQEDGKRKLDEAYDLCSNIKTENKTNATTEENVAINGKWYDDDDYQSMPKKIRESYNNAQSEQEQRPRKTSASSSSTASSGNHNQNPRRPIEYETKPDLLARRQKDIDYGKNTIGYDRYIQQIPKDKRTKDHPRTPPMHLKYTRRGWDGMVKLWRKQLHIWDPPKENSDDDEFFKDDESGDENGACSP